VPILEATRRAGRLPRSLRAVLNGTSNYVLERMHAGSSLTAAVTAARVNGFAEADPTRDLHGLDAAEKLVLIARQLQLELSIEDVDRDGCSAAAWSALQPGILTRQIATLRIADHRCSARVALEPLAAHDPFAILPEAWNAVLFDPKHSVAFPIRGQGAGRWPTAEAVLADLLQLKRELEPSAASNTMLHRHPLRSHHLQPPHAHVAPGLSDAIPAAHGDRLSIDASCR
jgi:homoserine dehydrogenase